MIDISIIDYTPAFTDVKPANFPRVRTCAFQRGSLHPKSEPRRGSHVFHAWAQRANSSCLAFRFTRATKTKSATSDYATGAHLQIRALASRGGDGGLSVREPLLRSFSSADSSHDSWLNRIRENLALLLIPDHFRPSSANGAPIHLLKFDKSLRPARAQSMSLVTHAAILAALAFFVVHPPRDRNSSPSKPGGHETPLMPWLRSLVGPNPSDAGGKGGGNNPLPPTRGNPPPYSSLVLVKPSLPQNHESQAPIPPTLLDPSAAPILAPTPDIGLPWMSNDTRSPGPGKGHGIGPADGDQMGNRGPGPFGDGSSNSRWGANFTLPTCAYCPYPTYTDEARHVKVQGTVTLQVLVGTDGRAQDIRIVKGVGYGLDERAAETVRTWKFVPAHDASKRTVATWVTVEAVFRLF